MLVGMLPYHRGRVAIGVGLSFNCEWQGLQSDIRYMII